MTITVTATTVYFHDAAANSDKFYRAYQMDKWAVFQYGRRGARGSFKTERCSSAASANVEVNNKIREKKRGGYSNDEVEQFDVDTAFALGFTSAAGSCQDLDKARRTANNGYFPPAPADPVAAPAPIQHELGALEEFNRRALAAISQAAVDPRAAMTTLAALNQDWSEIQTAIRKAESYLQTLDRMLLIGATK